MSKQHQTKYHVNKRLFLNRDADLPAFVIGIVEDTSEITDENSWKWGTVTLKMGDCYRRVEFDFSMDTREARKESLYKINRLAAVVNAVRDALEKEAQSLNKRPEPKETKPEKSEK